MKTPLAAALIAVLAAPVAAQDPPAEPPSGEPPAAEPPPEAPGSAAPEPSEAQPEIKPPAVKTPAEPRYPAQALADRVHAVVVLEIAISEDGAVTDATVASLTVIPEGGEPAAGDGRYGFAKAAIEAARAMAFSPAEQDGVPFAVRINFTYRFRLPAKAPEPAPADQPPARKPVVNLRGVLLERGSRTRVAGATVTVYRGEGDGAEGFEATSDAFGKFELYDLAPGEWKIRIDAEGYLTATTTETVNAGELLEANLYIEKGESSPYDVTVEAERPRKEVNRRSLDIEAIAKVPGTISDDPVLVVENLPGVARAGGGQIVVRGSGPEDTGVFVNGIGVPLIYHFGGLKSVLPSSVVGGIDFYPGNYSVAYGRSMGGVFDLKLKYLEPDRVHGSADISVLDTSLYLEAPIGDKAAIAFAGRRSYLDFVLSAAIPDDAGVALTTAPRYYDYQILGNWRPQPSHDFRWLFLGSDDKFALLFDDAVDEVGPGVVQNNDISATTAFQRIIGEYGYTPSPALSNRLRLSVGFDQVALNLLGAARAEVDIMTAQVRETLSWQAHERVRLDVGLDGQAAQLSGSFRFPQPPREGQDESGFEEEDFLETEFDSEVALAAAPFVEAQIDLGRLSLVPGLRLDYFGVTNEIGVDPRITARFAVAPRVTAKAGAAVVHQEPFFLDIDPVFGNPELGLQRALQYSVGAEWKPLDFLKADVTLFYKDMENLVSPTDALIERDGQMVPALLDNGGEGRVYGAEVFVEHELSNNLRGWLSYTLSRAERTDSGETDSRLFDYDQTHILALVGSYQLPRNWELGLRLRLVTGSPYTPIVGGIFDSAVDRYTPIYGVTNSDRLPMFQQLDARVDKTWIMDTWKLSAYLSLINATNHGNVESVTYNFDYTERGSIRGLPIIPVFGVKGQW